ncbi:MAG: acyl-CoA dehydrogenase [Deltaproteobacteria bacterium HGW-Deltaproteobacteria-1]|jgi:alkylation response protein AidB-like acyl-CoA dehydrogenase|nr:MAG: acyl-CoA dehydrogenase [Deltaproteobacteria bacterium HGW-Deltaproteobacteria-1]
MSNFNSDDSKPFADLAQSFAARELTGKVAEHDRFPFGGFYEDVLKKIHEVGFLNAALPVELGGAGFGIEALCAILENISEVDASPAGIIFTQALSQKILMAAGAGKLAATLSASDTAVKASFVAFPVYVNPASTDTLPVAQNIGGDYALTGRIELLVLGNLARQAIVGARTGQGPDYSFFLVDLDGKGVEKSEPVFTLGLHACPAVDVTFQGARVQLIGEENAGPVYFEQVLPQMNAAAVSISSGILRGTYSEALAYAQRREQGGRPIVLWSEVAMMLADLSIKADVAAMCVCQSCRELEQKQIGYESRVCAAALHVSALACEATVDGVQVLGGYGYMKDYGQEKRYRDARMVQALLGSVPMKKLAMIRRLSEIGTNSI